MLKFQKLLEISKNFKQQAPLNFEHLRTVTSKCSASSSPIQFSKRTLSRCLNSWWRQLELNEKMLQTPTGTRTVHKVGDNEIDYATHLNKINEGLTIIDVRNPDELEKHGRVPGAMEIPLPVLETEFSLSPEEWKEKHKMKKPDLESQIMVICGSGVRSRKGVAVLKRHGYNRLFSYKGGYNNYKVQK